MNGMVREFMNVAREASKFLNCKIDYN